MTRISVHTVDLLSGPFDPILGDWLVQGRITLEENYTVKQTSYN